MLEHVTYITCCVQVVSWISTKGEQFLDKHTEIGDSIGHVKTLQEDFDNFENKAKVMCCSRVHEV